MLSRSLYVCMQCGTCSSACSVRYELNLRKLIASLIGGGEFWSEQLWNCTNCRICQDRCPRGIKLTEAIIEAKKRVIETGRVPEDVRRMLESVYKFGNPFGVGKTKRNAWHKGIDVKFADEGDFEYLLFVGCGVTDERIAEVARKAANLLEAAGINFAVLREEDCCGNDVLAVGEEGLFAELKERNLATFERFGVERIITISPHCYNAFRNHYGIETYHISEVLLEAVEDARLKFSKVTEVTVAYHDPCYLGRYNGVYDAPRKLLKSVPGLQLVEMQRNRELAICCGGGAGNVVRDVRMRPSLFRIDEAEMTGAEMLAVACPFCLMMLEDAAKIRNSGVTVRDIVEIVYDSVF